ncbi:MAG: tetratricopeptide repeat protein [Planctomycetes bacterium]|nr:tetratricopeptide repeat protein [Planctomycetota bacterium]
MTKLKRYMDVMPEPLAEAKFAVESRQLERAAEILADKAEKTVSQIFEADPTRTDLVFEIAELLLQTKNVEQAENWYKKILAKGPDAAAYNKLGRLCEYMGRLWEAVTYQRKALEVQPDRGELFANLGRLLICTGEVKEGVTFLQRAAEKLPQNAQIHSILLFHLHQLSTFEPERLFAEHKKWGQTFAPLKRAKTSHSNDRNPDRRLRVGYISPDFRRTSVAYFFESLLDGHDGQVVETYGYGNVEFPDSVTERLQGKFNCYHNIYGIDDKQVVELIESDEIDILVDLAGHTGNNRLLVMSYKPAPIQVTWLGYPDTTGVEAIDYRLTDVLADPAKLQKYYTEKLVCLPDGFLCYRPADFASAVAPLPAEKNGFITFGSFNNNCKMNKVVIGLWAKILKETQNSRLLLKFKGGNDEQIRQRYHQQFRELGIEKEKVLIYGWGRPDEHLKLYDHVDIALDTYPYNGTTTTCEALWMGVPVVSLVGQYHASRVGLSILSRVGLEFFAASNPEEYVSKTIALASNIQSLAQIRTSMRARIANSGLCYAKGFARNLEAAYRKMWHRWTETE